MSDVTRPHSLRIRRGMVRDSHVDARAMAAIDVDRERAQRNGQDPQKPAARVAQWGDTGLREYIEEIVGEPLL